VISADQITVFASSNGEIAGATTVVADTPSHGISIKASVPKAVTLKVPAFPNLSDGTYTLLVQVSSSLDQESNSVTGPSVTVAAPFLDLGGAAVTAVPHPNPARISNPARIGKGLTLTIELTNTGNITSGAMSLNVGLSTDGLTESTTIENTMATLKIKPNKAGVLHFHFKIPTTVLPGAYQAYVSITDGSDSTTLIGQAFDVVAVGSE
jgi:uncharacterized membrane protein